MPLREYAGAAKRTALVGDITASSTNLTVSDATGYPTGATAPFVIAIDTGIAAEEKVLVASRSGNTLTVSQRGFDGTTAAAHGAGSAVDHVLSATDIREANTFINHGGTLTASAASATPLTVKGAASQTANLFRVERSDGTAYTLVGGLGAFSHTCDPNLAAPNATFQTGNPARQALVVRGATSQTANLFEAQDSAGTVLARVSNDGSFVVEKGVLRVNNTTSSATPLRVKGAASQTANLAEFQNSAGTVLTEVQASGAVAIRAFADFVASGAGHGIICRTPDNTKNYRIAVSNTGAVTVTLV